MGFKLESCFCQDLKTASFVAAYLSLAVNSILLIWTIMIWAILANIEVDDLVAHIFVAVFTILEISYFVMYLANFIFSTLLLIGLHKDIRGCIIAYLVFTPIFIIAHSFEFIMSIKERGNDVFSLFWITVSFFVIVGSCYSQLLVFTYYRQANFGRTPVIEDAI